MIKKANKKTVGKSMSPKKSEQKNFFKRYVTLKNVLIGIVLLLVAFQGYKYLMDQYNIRLLDKAEAKMLQIDFPGDAEPTVERYCSERSVKYGSPGRPICGVGISSRVEGLSTSASEERTVQLIEGLKNLGITVSIRRDDGDASYYDLLGLSSNLSCTMSDFNKTGHRNEKPYHGLYIYCQKTFESKQYPIRD